MILVTGGAGFIGSNFVRYVLGQGHKVRVLDKLTYAGRLENLKDVLEKIEFVKGDICDPKIVEKSMKDVDVVVHFAAESHVDRSIESAENFVRTNVYGTYVLLEKARKYDVKFVHISTDEVYGSIREGYFSEEDPLDPSSPYSATKASSDLLARAYYKTYGLPVMITRSSNNYGPYQYPEKLIPKIIIKALRNEPLPIYGTGKNVRDWIFVEDNCAAIYIVMKKGNIGEIYNIGAGNEKTNLEVVEKILDILGKPKDLITFVEDRPGHDWRYALRTDKIRALGWTPQWDFEKGLKYTVEWYRRNKWWWEPLL